MQDERGDRQQDTCKRSDDSTPQQQDVTVLPYSPEPVDRKSFGWLLPIIMGLLLIALALPVLMWLWTAPLWSAANTRDTIAGADRVVIRVYLMNNVAGGKDILVLDDPNDIRQLAQSFKRRSPWEDVEVASAISIRLRATSKGRSKDVIFRGFESVRREDGRIADVTKAPFKTIWALLQKHGVKWPKDEELGGTGYPSSRSVVPQDTSSP